MKFETKAIRLSYRPDAGTNSVIPGIQLGVSFRFDELEKNTGFDYSRSNNPTRGALERTIAGLENAEFGIAFSSGMAATDGILSLLFPGDEVVAVRNLYSGAPRLFDEFYAKRGVKFTYIQGDDPEEYRAHITDKTKMVWVETPTNPQLQIIDIAAVATVSRAAGVPLVVDNTFASPFFQRPLDLNADIVLHSTTKFISGHHDVIGGMVVTNDSAIAERVRFYQNTAGAIPGAFDCYLIMRGVKTLAIRMKAHEANSMAVANYLKTKPMVKQVLYPGLPEHPGHDLAKRQMHGFGGMLSFTLDATRERLNDFCRALDLIHFAESLGGTESLLCHPQTMSHAVLTEDERLRAGVTPDMLRMSVGLEHTDDLIEELDRAFAAACA